MVTQKKPAVFSPTQKLESRLDEQKGNEKKRRPVLSCKRHPLSLYGRQLQPIQTETARRAYLERSIERETEVERWIDSAVRRVTRQTCPAVSLHAGTR